MIRGKNNFESKQRAGHPILEDDLDYNQLNVTDPLSFLCESFLLRMVNERNKELDESYCT